MTRPTKDQRSLGHHQCGPEPLVVERLDADLVLAQSTVTELANRSQARGLVERIVSPDDQRVVLFRTTREGRVRLTRSLDALDRERKRLGGALDALVAASRAGRGAVSPPAA